MKKVNLLVGLLLCSLAVSAQSDLFVTPYKWSLKKWGISFGNDRDMLGTVDHNYLLSTVRGNTEMNYSNLAFRDSDVSSMTCDNPHLRINTTFNVPRIKRAELNVSAIFVGNKIDEVAYYNENSNYGPQRLRFQAYTNEVGLESVFLMSASSKRGGLRVYGGAGTNMGVSWGNINIDAENIQTTSNNEVINFSRSDEPIYNPTIEHKNFYDSYEMKTGFHQRIFAQAGVGFVFVNRIELGFEYRRGFGYRAIAGAATQATEYHSGALSLSWRMK